MSLIEATAAYTLRETLKPHSLIYALERRRSRTATTSTVDFKHVEPDGSIVSIGAEIAAMCGLEYDATMRGVVIRQPTTAAGLVFMVGRRLFGEAELRMEFL